MMAHSSAARARIVERGADLLSAAGLSGLTLGTLATEVGLSKSGLFAHFRSKEAVQLALLERAATLAEASVVAPALEATPGLPRLRALVERWFGWPARAGLRGGCPVAAALFELDDAEDGPVRATVAAMEAHWRALLSDLTAEAVKVGDLRPGLDVAQFVWELCGVYLGHHASTRFLRDPAADDRARVALDALFVRAGAPAAAD